MPLTQNGLVTLNSIFIEELVHPLFGKDAVTFVTPETDAGVYVSFKPVFD